MIGRLSTVSAALVIARRDFGAILFSRSFLFFLLGPLFPVLVGMMAGGVGQRVQSSADQTKLGIVMQAADVDAMRAGPRTALMPRIGAALPDLKVVKRLQRGEEFDVIAALNGADASVAVILTGTPEAPQLIGVRSRIKQWQGPVSLIAAEAMGRTPYNYPTVTLTRVAGTASSDRGGRFRAIA